MSATDDIRSRRRPRAVALLWAWEACLGVALGSSFASVVGTAYAHHPDGDAGIFAPGGLTLLDLARHSGAARGPLLSATLLVILAARVLGLVTSATVYADLAPTRGSRSGLLQEPLARALRAFPASFSLELFALAIQAALLSLGFVVSAALSTTAERELGVRRGDLLEVAVCATFALAALLVGVVGDLARAAVVRHELGAMAAAARGLRCFSHRAVVVSWSYAWRAASSWAPVLAVAVVATELGGRGGRALLVLAVLHQLVILARAAIQASWMSRALRAIDR